MKEITLPIKCSTVKSLHEQMEKVSDAAIYLTIAMAFCWSITDIYRWAYPLYLKTIPEFKLLEISIATTIFVIVTYFILVYAYEKMPKIECIKDEEQP